MRALLTALLDSAVWNLARRDARRGLGRMLASSAALGIGLAALVAIRSFGVRLDEALDDQARELMGADLRVESGQALPEELDAELRRRIEQIPGIVTAERITFLSMVRLEHGDSARLVRVRAVEGDYPFYGALETVPAEAGRTYRGAHGALVDRSALEQLGGAVGDTLLVGDRAVRIVGEIVKIPGESLRQSWFGPRVYLPLDALDPALLGKGSRISYDTFCRLPETADPRAVAKSLDDLARSNDLRVRTAADLRASWGRSAQDAEGFLSLVAFVALLLGGLGVASAVHVHVLRKRPLAALLRCLGAPSSTAMTVILLQTAAIGVVGTLFGVALGAALQSALPGLLGDFLPVEVARTPVPSTLIGAAVFGLSTTLAFAALPLAPLRHVSALAALRRIELPTPWRDPWVRAVAVLLLSAIVVFALTTVRKTSLALGFVAGLGAVLVLLFLVSRSTLAILRRIVPRRFPFALRQGLANLHRPANQTAMLLLCIGMGAFLLCMLSGSRRQLMHGLTTETGAGRANLVFFDVQDSQLEGMLGVLEEQRTEVLDQVPIVAMRLRSLDGRSIEQLRSDPARSLPVWPLLRTYRSSYRASLEEGERIVAGRFEPTVADDPQNRAVPISLEDGIAEQLGAGMGSRLDFDVQGVLIPTRVTSLRRVEWRSARPNFYALFPLGVLDGAPKTHVVLVHCADPNASVRTQRAVIDRFPTISAVDVENVLSLVDEVLDRLRSVVQFLAAFSMATGAVVLLGALLASRRHRIEETLLLRTLGASRSQVRAILLAEWSLLGLVGGAAGAGLALLGVAALAQFVFHAPVDWPIQVTLLVPLGTMAMTSGIGALAGHRATQHPPLEILRLEQSA